MLQNGRGLLAPRSAAPPCPVGGTGGRAGPAGRRPTGLAQGGLASAGPVRDGLRRYGRYGLVRDGRRGYGRYGLVRDGLRRYGRYGLVRDGLRRYGRYGLVRDGLLLTGE